MRTRITVLLATAGLLAASGLAAQGAGRCRGEQRLVLLAPPHVLAVGLDVARAAVPRWRPVGEEELGLFHRGQEQVGVAGQRGVQGGGAGLGYPGDEEVG
jgi:hypothetical protein